MFELMARVVQAIIRAVLLLFEPELAIFTDRTLQCQQRAGRTPVARSQLSEGQKADVMSLVTVCDKVTISTG